MRSMHVKNQIANRVREWLNSEWGRLKLSSYDNQKEPFDDKTMPLLSPKGMIICAHSTCHFMSWDSSQHNPPFFISKLLFRLITSLIAVFLYVGMHTVYTPFVIKNSHLPTSAINAKISSPRIQHLHSICQISPASERK